MKLKATIVPILTFSFFYFNIEIPKRAFRLYEKGDLEKTVEALEKSLARDSLNPAANYLYSRLYADTAFGGYHIDSAYRYVNEAIEDYGYVTEPKDLEKLQRVGVDSLSLARQKDKIDSLQFEVIKGRHTIADYNWFMQTHTDANQLPRALVLRNYMAFEDAEKVNTWQSYKAFMEKYPQAKNFGTAEKRYKKLIFDERTADGKLKSYTDFLEEFPGTPYREKAEQQIFEISTAVNTLEAYTGFLKKYPNQRLARKIYPRLYHLYKELYESAAFLSDFNIPSINDSLINVIRLEQGYWLPKLENPLFTFFDENGENMPMDPLSSIGSDYRCKPIFTDFIFGSYYGVPKVFGRNGVLIAEGVFDSVRDEGYGCLVLADERGERLVHKSKEIIIDEPFESIRVLNQHFIRTQKDGLYGLTTINGRAVLNHEYDDIDTLLNYLRIEKDGRIGLVKQEQLFPAIDGEALRLTFPFEQIEVLENGLLWATKAGQEGVLNGQLEEVIPFDNQAIYDREYGWLLEQNGQKQLLHQAYPFLKEKRYDKLLENSQWIAAKEGSSWTLIDRLGKLPVAGGYDSLNFLGENMVMLYQSGHVLAQFRNGKQLLMKKAWRPSLLVPQNYTKTGETALFDFFMLSNRKNYRKVYNTHGREILSATYKKVTAMGPDLLRLQKRNTALVDSTGKFVLKFIYDGVGSYDRGYVSIVKGGKVGILNLEKGLAIPPAYESLITPYSDTVLMAKKGGLIGFINGKNKALSGFDFDEVKYWNDSLALVRIEEEWLLHHIATEEAVYEKIMGFEFLENSETEKRILVSTEKGKGVYSATLGELIEPTYDDIKVLGTAEKPVYFAVKMVTEADLYVVIYFDAYGKKLFTLTYRQDQYFKIACQTSKPAN